MKNKVLENIRKYSMLSSGDSVLVGLSGGADSMCLVSVLWSLRDELSISVSAVHINHCIRGEEADRDEKFVVDFCKSKGIPLFVFRENIPEIAAETGESTELCARRIRYEIFEKCSEGKIATAHSASDRVETLIFNLSRGASLNGLCSIPPVRDNIIRPLINVTRGEIEEYCKTNGIGYITDSSNLSDEYSRNKIRLNVIPQLTKVNSSFEKNAVRCIELLNAENAYIESVSRNLLEQALENDGKLSVAVLLTADECIVRRALIAYLEKNSVYDYEYSHISLIYEKLGQRFALCLPGNKRIASDGKQLLVEAKKAEAEEKELKTYSFCKEDGIAVENDKNRISVSFSSEKAEDKNSICLDADKIGEQLVFRSRQAGDEIRLINRGCRKPLRKLFNELKIPPEERELKYVLADDNGVIYVESIGADARCICDKKTKKYLIIKMECGYNE